MRIGLVVPASASEAALSVARGVRLGASEAKQTAALFGADVDLYEATGTGPSGINAAAVSLLSQRKVQMLIAAAGEDVDAMSQFGELHNLLFLNVASRHGSLRLACRRNTFHVEAPDIAYQNARALGHQTVSSNRPRSPNKPSATSDSVVLWSAMLERFGASQVNSRYRAIFNTGMNGGAWAGWAAVKFATEAALRARSTELATVLKFLEAPTTQFDGHKGWPLSFRRADHQLRQPLYIVVPSAGTRAGTVVDVPDIRQLSAGSREPGSLLDRLNAHPGTPACAWPPL